MAVVSGSVLTPLFLPMIPSPSFAVKGWLMGIVITAVPVFTGLIPLESILLMVTALLLFPILSSYLAVNFTGCSTYTGISGVNKELKISIPIYVAAGIISAVLLIVYKITEWGTV
jgi:hypothetical protein